MVKQNLFTILEQHHLLQYVPEHIQKRVTRHSIERFVQESPNEYLVEVKRVYRITILPEYQKVEVLKDGAWVLQRSLPCSVHFLYQALKQKLLSTV